MRILFLHVSQSGLTAEYKVHLTLASSIKDLDFDPVFIWQNAAPEPVTGVKVMSHDFGRDMSVDPKPNRYHRAYLMGKNFPKSVNFFRETIRQVKPDVLYTSQQYYDVFIADLLSRYYRLPHIIHLHYNVGPWLGKHSLQVIQKSTRLIAVSEFIRQTAILQGVDPENIDTVINPLPSVQPQLTPSPHFIRRELGIDADAPVIVAVGRLDPGKGHRSLFRAFAKVLKIIPEARLIICGQSTSREGYENLLINEVQKLEIGPYTHFVGQRDDIPAIFDCANVFCLPTELDPCPLTFLEAMQAGLPVVAFYSGGVPEIAIHDRTGLLSYPGDIDALARNLVTVLSDPAYAQCLGAAGKIRATTEFSPEVVAKHWYEVVQKRVADRWP